MRFAHVKNGVVVNVIEAKSADIWPGQTLVQSDSASTGDAYDGATFTKPASAPEAQRRKSAVRKLADVLIAKGVIAAQDINGMD